MSVGRLYVFFGKMSIYVLCQFLNLVICNFLMLACMNYLHILDINPSSDISFGNDIFLPFSRLSFHFVNSFLYVLKIFTWKQPIYLFLPLFPFPEEKYPKKMFIPMSKTALHMFSCRGFIVLGHIFKYLIHFCVSFSLWCVKVTQASVSLLIFCLDDLSIDISMVLSISPL